MQTPVKHPPVMQQHPPAVMHPLQTPVIYPMQQAPGVYPWQAPVILSWHCPVMKNQHAPVIQEHPPAMRHLPQVKQHPLMYVWYQQQDVSLVPIRHLGSTTSARDVQAADACTVISTAPGLSNVALTLVVERASVLKALATTQPAAAASSARSTCTTLLTDPAASSGHTDKPFCYSISCKR